MRILAFRYSLTNHFRVPIVIRLTRLSVICRKDKELGFKWQPPVCEETNGNITGYDYRIEGKDDWNQGIFEGEQTTKYGINQDVVRAGTTPRLTTLIPGLKPGSLYAFEVRCRQLP